MITTTELAQLGLFDAKVPRYTSYPTAPHFHNRVRPDHVIDWIRAIPTGGSISLYVHVPFCRRLCWFCACRTQGTQNEAPVAAYLEVLKAELSMLKQHLPKGVTLNRLHWGGGTPTLLSAGMMDRLAETIFDLAPLGPGAEFSVEIDPNEIDAARLDVLARHGMNRASIGVQDFDPQIQATIGRAQSFDVTRAASDMLRVRGISSLNADILFGLPHQNRERITNSVMKLLSLSPDRVALYGYAHVPWLARRQSLIPTTALPSPRERLALFSTAQRLFKWDGYNEIGIDHFATPTDGLSTAQAAGKLRRNFQGYTDDLSEVLIGIGASAISRFPQGFAQNASATSQYVKAIQSRAFSTVRGFVFSAEDKVRGRMIEALMCDFQINAAAISEECGVPAQGIRKLFDQAARAFPNVVQVTDQTLFIPASSKPLTRMIARCFDAYALDKAGHSSAI